jgi:large subunit ribosomal protein L4
MSRKLNIVDCQGAVVGDYTLPENCIELERGTQAVHDVVVAFLAGERAGTACTKTRSEVRGGGAKPFRQKGTGRARSGSIRNPIWTGGGTIFGPKPRSFSKKVNKKVRTLALKRAFSEKIAADEVVLLDKLELQDGKTKSVKLIFDKLNVDSNALVAVGEYSENAVRATGNLANVILRKADTVNVYQLLRFNKIIFTQDGLDAFIKRLA